MNDIHLNKLPFDDGFLLIQTKWNTEYIELYIHETSLNTTFKGILLKEEVEESAKELEIPFQDFHKECREALTTNLGLPAFKYDLNMEQQKFLLIKKDPHTIIQYLDIRIKEDQPSANKMLMTAFDFINLQSEQNIELKNQKLKMEESYRATCDIFERCLDEKNRMETKLLKKFAALLNSKKAKIAELLMREGSVDHTDEKRERSSKKEKKDVDELDRGPSTSASAAKLNKSYERNSVENAFMNDVNDDEFLAATEIMTQLAERPAQRIKSYEMSITTVKENSCESNMNERSSKKKENAANELEELDSGPSTSTFAGKLNTKYERNSVEKAFMNDVNDDEFLAATEIMTQFGERPAKRRKSFEMSITTVKENSCESNMNERSSKEKENAADALEELDSGPCTSASATRLNKTYERNSVEKAFMNDVNDDELLAATEIITQFGERPAQSRKPYEMNITTVRENSRESNMNERSSKEKENAVDELDRGPSMSTSAARLNKTYERNSVEKAFMNDVNDDEFLAATEIMTQFGERPAKRRKSFEMSITTVKENSCESNMNEKSAKEKENAVDELDRGPSTSTSAGKLNTKYEGNSVEKAFMNDVSDDAFLASTQIITQFVERRAQRRKSYEMSTSTVKENSCESNMNEKSAKEKENAVDELEELERGPSTSASAAMLSKKYDSTSVEEASTNDFNDDEFLAVTKIIAQFAERQAQRRKT